MFPKRIVPFLFVALLCRLNDFLQLAHIDCLKKKTEKGGGRVQTKMNDVNNYVH